MKRKALVEGVVALCVILCGCRTVGRTTPTIESTPAKTDWPRARLLIPELSAVPEVDGTVDPDVWDGAAAGELRHPLGSNQPIEADTTFRIGHRDGTIYLLITYDWPADLDIVANAKDRDDPVWSDDGGEIFFTRIDDLRDTRQLLFNLGGVRADNDITWAVGFGESIVYDGMWDPEWQLACRRGDGVYVAEFAIPLKEMIGLPGHKGDVFRFNLMRNRIASPQRLVHYSPVEGGANCNPPNFGMALLTGPRSGPASWDWVDSRGREGLMFTGAHQLSTATSGAPVSLTVFNPLASALGDGLPLRVEAALRDEADQVIARESSVVHAWPHTFTVRPGAVGNGRYRFELSSPDTESLAFSAPLEWRPTVRLEAEDRAACRAEGRSWTRAYPRSVGMGALFFGEKTRVSVSCHGRAVYLLLPPVFISPGPWYGSFAGAVLRYQVDDRPPRELPLVTARRVTALAEDLSDGPHTVRLELAQGYYCGIDGFLISNEPLAQVHGIITSNSYAEQLVDVRADVMDGERIVRSEYVRNPVNGTFSLLGLEPGTYRLRIAANGWQPHETEAFDIERPGQKVDLGVMSLAFDHRALSTPGGGALHYSRTLSISPGDSFHTQAVLSAAPTAARLVSPYRTVGLRIVEVTQRQIATGYNPMWAFRVRLEAPAAMPHDMYALELTYPSRGRDQTVSWHQAVCVREVLPPSFHMAGVSHMNTWGQQTSDYLARLAQMAQLAGARTFLAANEVNAPYIAGGFKDLRIPYVVTPGNHTMGRWDDFFGPRTSACDDGPMRIVSFGHDPTDSWLDARRLLGEREDATARVLVCYEGYPPLDLVAEQKVDLLFDGHSTGSHPEQDKFPPHVFHFRAPDYQAARWIPMEYNGVAAWVGSAKDITSFRVPRDGPAPLRVEFSGPNDGTADGLTARLINETELDFTHARLRLVLKDGDYHVGGAKVLQSFASDDGGRRVIDVEVRAKAGTVTEITAKRR